MEKVDTKMLWLNNAKIIAILAVIMIHVADSFLRQYTSGCVYWWVANVYDSASRWAVPVFVMVSGALLLNPSKQENIPTFYRKRLSRIATPLIFWSFFFVIPWVMFKAFISDNPVHINLPSLFSGQPYYHLWFLYMILGLYIMTPWFRILTKHTSTPMLLGFTVIGFILALINGGSTDYFSPPFTQWFLMYIPYFFMGHLIVRTNNIPAPPLLWLTFILCVIFTAIGNAFSDTAYFYGYLSITVIPMSISLMYLLKTWNSPIGSPQFMQALVTLSFGVYLIHPIILELIHYHGHSSLQVHPILSIPALTFITFGIALLSAWFISKIPILRRII